MAEGDIELAVIGELVKTKLLDVRFWLWAASFVMGFLAVFSSIRTDWIILGPVADFINNNILRLFGPFTQLLLLLLLGAFLFEIIINAVLGDKLTMAGIISTILVVWIIVLLFLNVATLFGTGDNIYSVMPVVQSVVGGG